MAVALRSETPDVDGGEKVVIALTFASVPKAGTLDADLLYRIRIRPDRRITRVIGSECVLHLAAEAIHYLFEISRS